MEGSEVRKLHPREVLRQVAASMSRQHDFLSVTLPSYTTWRTAIRAAEASMKDVDGEMLIMPPRATNPPRLREIAIQAARDCSQPESPMGNIENNPGLGIRTHVDLASLKPPQPRSISARQRLREAAKKSASDPAREPYVTLRAQRTEQYLPAVTANITVRGIDEVRDTPIVELKATEIIWDTGAHYTIITEELLSAEFRQYMKNPVHDPYRSSGGLCIQMDATIAFTNASVSIGTVARIVPKAKMPNNYCGVLFGQCMCIDRLSYFSIPRRLLQAKGSIIPESCWGDIIVSEYLDEEDNIVEI